MDSPITTSDSSDTDDEQVEPNVKKIPTMEEEISKRPWTPANSTSHWPKERICNQCGKAFPSLRELCGHIKAAHSENDKDSIDDDDDDDDDDSPSTSSDSDRSSDMEIKNPRSRSRTTDEKLKGVVTDSSSSSDSDIDGCEVEKAAKCLIMLKRDSFFHNNNNNNINSSVHDVKSSMKEAPVIDSDSECFLQEWGNADSEIAFERKPKNRAFNGSEKPFSLNTRGENEYQNIAEDVHFAGIDSKKRRQIVRSDEGHGSSKKRSRYECDNCRKTFTSYQGLGGHRPCNRTIDDCENKTRHEVSCKSSKYSREDENTEDNPGSSRIVKPASKSSPTEPNAKKNKAYVCPYCDKVFKNGQALGGHKRSHFLDGLNVGISTQVNNKTNKTELLSFLQQEDADDQVEEDIIP